MHKSEWIELHRQTGEMEVKNPLFLDDPTPATPAAKRQGE